MIIDHFYYSPRMRTLQRENLGCVNTDTEEKSLKTKYGNEIAWYEQLHEVPRDFSFFIGKSFLKK